MDVLEKNSNVPKQMSGSYTMSGKEESTLENLKRGILAIPESLGPHMVSLSQVLTNTPPPRLVVWHKNADAADRDGLEARGPYTKEELSREIVGWAKEILKKGKSIASIEFAFPKDDGSYALLVLARSEFGL